MFKNLKFSYLKLILILALIVELYDVVSVRASVVTYYVKWDATGAGNGISWADAYTDLQSAISAASSGDEIWVAAGTYKPTTGTDRTISFVLKNGVAVYGGFAGTETLRTQRNFETNVTVLSGDIGVLGDNSDNSYHVVIGSDTNSATVLDGFTITKGNANTPAPLYQGGGLYSHLGNLTLSNLIFSENSAAFGGGMWSAGEYPGGITVQPALRNVTFINNSAEEGGGMEIRDFSNPTLTNVIFIGNTALTYGGGMLNNSSCNPTLTNVIFTNNTAGDGGGMFNWNHSSAILTNATFSGNSASTYGGGISNEKSSTLTLTNVTISGNSAVTYGDGVYNDSTSSVNIRNSILYGNGEEIHGSAVVNHSIVQGGYSGTGNLDADPVLGPLQNNGGFTQTMALGNDSPAIDAGDDANCTATDQRGVTRPQGVHCDIGAYEYDQILYVKSNATGANNGTSWINAYTDLQSALSVASSGDEIWVAAGTYKPTTGTDRTVSFTLKNGVAIYGGFAGTETLRTQRDFKTNVSILSGDIGVAGDNSDNSYHVVIGSDTNSATILDGFTITKGNADTVAPLYYGGGLYSYLGNLTLSNLIIKDNVAAFGGGMYSEGHSSSSLAQPTLTNVTFINNSASGEGGGMENKAYSNPTLTNVAFIGNTSNRSGGGMLNMVCSVTLTNVTFSGNTAALAGGGLMNGRCYATLNNVTFNGNSSAQWGGGMDNAGSISTLTNVTFTNNSAATNGGAISNEDSSGSLTMTNVTISGNSAVTYGDGIYNDSTGSVNIYNSILYGNGEEIYGTAVVNYSIVQGGYSGTGNLDADPLLGPLQDNGGFTKTMALGDGSPAINTGNDANCPATDQRGMIRPQSSHCDIGAYEYDQILYVKSNATGANNGSSWTDAYTDLQSALSAASSGDEIWVAAGTYKPTTGTDRTISFVLKNGVAVYGGFAGTETLRTQRNFETNLTILSGDIGIAGDNSDNSYHVVVGSNTDNTVLLDGFTVTAGNANGDMYPLKRAMGGGMYNDKGSPTLMNLTFSNNAALYFGGGMYNFGEADWIGSNPVLTNITFINNSATEGGGMENADYSSPSLTNVTFIGNTVIRCGGGMININYSSPNLTDVVFNGNTADCGGGMINWNHSSSALTNVTFSGNSAQWGGGMDNGEYSAAILTNVTFNGNSAATYGGGISNEKNSTLTLTNVTISGNSAVTYGDGVYSDSTGSVNIRNSILYGNGEEIYGSAVVNHSIVQGGYSGTGNLDTDPVLDPLQNNGGFTHTMALGNDSPAIDAGDDVNCPSTDQRGVTRPQGAHCDIGAYEYYEDTTLPTVNTFTVTTPSDSLDIPITAFTASDNVGVTGYLITESDTAPAASDIGWSGSAPSTYHVSSDGTYTLYPWAKDAAGNVSLVFGSPRIVVVDTNVITLPDTSITSHPINPTKLRIATFTFTSDVSGVTFQCSLDGSAFANCVSPKNYSGLTNKTHNFKVRAKDALGNVDATPAEYVWLVDLTAPNTIITVKPNNPSNSDTANFEFTGTEAGTFECSLDNSAYANCVSPKQYTGFINGSSHTFKVRAIDAVGNVDASPASYTWKVDLLSPNTTITSKPASLANSTTAKFAFTSTEIGSTFECNLDGAGFTTCLTPKTYIGLGEGLHIFEVRAKDMAGNVDATSAQYTWTIDLTVPDTSITTHPTGPTTSKVAMFEFTNTEAGGFQCSLDGSTFASCVSPKSYSGLSSKKHTFKVRGVDVAGNADATPSEYSWVVDLTVPNTIISIKPKNPSKDSTAIFGFSATAATGLTGDDIQATYECSLDGATFAPCTNPQAYSGLLDNTTHTLKVRARDFANRVDSTPASYTWKVDLVSPDTNITLKPASLTKSISAKFSFTSTETGSTFECSLDVSAFSACTSSKSYSNLSIGLHTFEVRAVDKAGNLDPTPAQYTWEVTN